MLRPVKEAGTGMKTQAEKQACPSEKGACSHGELCTSLVTSTFQHEAIRTALSGGIFFKSSLLAITSGFPTACRVQLPAGWAAKVRTPTKNTALHA